MTLEEQKSKLAAARAKAQGALGKGLSEDLSLGSSLCGRGVRGVPLGVDREGFCYWKLHAADAFGGISLHWALVQVRLRNSQAVFMPALLLVLQAAACFFARSQ